MPVVGLVQSTHGQIQMRISFTHLRVAAALRPIAGPAPTSRRRRPASNDGPGFVPARPIPLSTAPRASDIQDLGSASSSRSEPLVPHLPGPAVVYREAEADTDADADMDSLRRNASSVGHVMLHSGKLELSNLDEWNENETC